MRARAKAPRPAKKSGFQAAVERTPHLRDKYRSGVQALENADRARLSGRSAAIGSVFVDEALKSIQPYCDQHRWDYAIGLVTSTGRELVLWLEVHHAASKQTEIVLSKLSWLRGWLRQGAPALERFDKKFVWLLSNTESNPNDRIRRNRLAQQHGLVRVQGTLDLEALR